jgi:hypothetical protein
MSQVAISGNASGTGTLTIAAPNTNSDYTLTLPTNTGTFNISGAANEVPAGTVSAPAITTTGDTNTGIWFPAADTIAFTEGGVESMRIDSSGNLLVGTTTNAITAYSAGKSLIQSADYSGAVAQLINSTSTTGTQYFLAFGRGASVCGQITSGSTNSTSFTTSSDYRLKKDVQPITGALAKVQALKPCAYKWIEDDTTSEGFIAHELAETFPQAVVGEKDAVNAEGNPVYQGVDTSFLIATLTAAIQELTARITALENK